ncbi:MAG: hypothetical protein NXI09_15855 [Bacteroidetes bacterium]|nr:hypothetical protein [Bacteroidota bacterium]
MKLRFITYAMFISNFLLGAFDADSLVIDSEQLLKEVRNQSVKVLVVDFRVQEEHLYLDWPKDVERLYLNSKGKRIKITESLFASFKKVKMLKLEGAAIETLPEFLYYCDDLEIIELVNCQLQDIWRSTRITDAPKVKRLVLRNVDVNTSKWVFEELFYSKQLSVKEILIYDESSPEGRYLLTKFFNVGTIETRED